MEEASERAPFRLREFVGVVVPTPKRDVVLSQNKLLLFWLICPLAPANKIEPDVNPLSRVGPLNVVVFETVRLEIVDVAKVAWPVTFRVFKLVTPVPVAFTQAALVKEPFVLKRFVDVALVITPFVANKFVEVAALKTDEVANKLVVVTFEAKILVAN